MFRESVGEQLLALFSGDGRRLVAVIEAYIDESGTDGRSPVICVGGYAGEHDEWTAFERAWEPTLRNAGIELEMSR